MTVGDRIKKQRESLGLTQTELAKKVSVSKQTLYKYETNIVTNIPSDKIELISKILDCSPSYLMGWETEKTSDFKSGEGAAILLKKYDLLSDVNKKAVLNIIDNLISTQSK